MFCKDTCRENLNVVKVDTLEVNKDDKKESDKDSKCNSMEIMPKKKSENLF